MIDKNEIEKRKQEIKDRLFNDLFVEKYDDFKESVKMINKAFEAFDINYQYDYNTFCKDFTDETMLYIDENPEVDITSYKEMFMSTPIIVSSLIKKIKDKYGFKNDPPLIKE